MDCSALSENLAKAKRSLFITKSESLNMSPFKQQERDAKNNTAVSSSPGKFQISFCTIEKGSRTQKTKSTQTQHNVRHVVAQVKPDTATISTNTRVGRTQEFDVSLQLSGSEKSVNSDIQSRPSSSATSSSNQSSSSSDALLVPRVRNTAYMVAEMERYPRLYTGIPRDSFGIIKLLSIETRLTEEDILLTFCKPFWAFRLRFSYLTNFFAYFGR
ncbi:unnamed protein product [Ceutorhynchus assimilis]|uniref:Uncharacterized protein n=1 Tax=Ceutorhynchus assimilis TaxID=467358 RepID=A0A9N9MDS2_9CUCU|nr:unnamed protein product [Ceutorhynchus assimilis]